MEAAERNRTEVLELIMADSRTSRRLLNSEDSEGRTALHLAAAAGHVQVVRGLLAHRVDIAAQRSDGFSALHIAAANGYAHIIASILRDPRADQVINLQTQEGRTALHVAIEAAAKLEKRGAAGLSDILKHPACNSAVQDNNGYTPIARAAELGLVEVVRELVFRQGAELRVGPAGDSVLHVAASAGHVEVVLLLLQEKVASAEDCNLVGETPLLAAMRPLKGEPSQAKKDSVATIVEALMSVRLPDAGEITRDTRNTVLHLALLARVPAVALGIIRRLRSSDAANPLLRQANAAGETPLLIAARSGDAASVRALLALPDINLEAADSAGVTAFAAAVSCDAPPSVADEIALALLQRGADPAVQYQTSLATTSSTFLDGSPVVAIAMARKLSRTVRHLIASAHSGGPAAEADAAYPVRFPDVERVVVGRKTALQSALVQSGKALVGPHGPYLRLERDSTAMCRACPVQGTATLDQLDVTVRKGMAVALVNKSDAAIDLVRRSVGYNSHMDKCWGKIGTVADEVSRERKTVRVRFDHGDSWAYPTSVVTLAFAALTSGVSRSVFVSSIKPAPPVPGKDAVEEPPLCICESCYEWDPPDVGAVLSLLEARGVNAADAVNAPGPEGMTALMLAAEAGLVEQARALVRAGADLFATDAGGRNALIHACLAGAGGVVGMLLDAVSDPQHRLARAAMLGQRTTAEGWGVLTAAMRPRHTTAAATTESVSGRRLEFPDLRRCIPVEVFARLRAAVIAADIHPLTPDANGDTPLVVAIRERRHAFALALLADAGAGGVLEAGHAATRGSLAAPPADPSRRGHASASAEGGGWGLEFVSSRGRYAAHWLCSIAQCATVTRRVRVPGEEWRCVGCGELRHPDDMRWYVGDREGGDAECEMCVKFSTEGDTAKLLVALLKATPQCVNHPDADGCTPIVLAARSSSLDASTASTPSAEKGGAAERSDRRDRSAVELLRTLHAFGAALDVEDPAESAPILLAAIRRKDVAVAQALVELGAPVDATTLKGESALDCAAAAGSAALVSLLLRKAPRRSTAFVDGATSLHRVCEWEDLGAALVAAQELLGDRPGGGDASGGIDVRAFDGEGRTALDVACSRGDSALELVERLLACRPAPPLESVAADGMRPIVRAIRLAAPRLVASLIRAGASADGAALHVLATDAPAAGDGTEWRLLTAVLDAGVGALAGVDAKGASALSLAAARGAPAAILRRMVAAKPSDLNARCSRKDTPLFAALRAGRVAAAVELMGCGASVLGSDADGRTVLMHLAAVAVLAAESAVSWRYVEPRPEATSAEVEKCRHCSAAAFDPRVGGVRWSTGGDAPACGDCRFSASVPALCAALGGGATAWVEVPCSAVLPPVGEEHTLPAGEYDSFEAAKSAADVLRHQHGLISIVEAGPSRYLLWPGSEPLPSAPPLQRAWVGIAAPRLPLLNDAASDGQTALSIALEGASRPLTADIARSLVACGASVNVLDASKATVFTRAMALRDQPRSDAVDGGVVGEQPPDVFDAIVARAVATSKRPASLIKYLGLDVCDSQGSPPLHALIRATIPQRLHRIKALCELVHPNDPAVGLNGGTGHNVLHRAVASDAPAAISILVAATPPAERPRLLEWRDMQGYTPLHLAAMAGNEAAVEALLACDARLDPQVASGKTAFDILRGYSAESGTRAAEMILRNATEANGGARFMALWSLALGNYEGLRAALGQSGRRGVGIGLAGGVAGGDEGSGMLKLLRTRSCGESLLSCAAQALANRAPPLVFESVWKALVSAMPAAEVDRELAVAHPVLRNNVFHHLAVAGARECVALLLRYIADNMLSTSIIDAPNSDGNHPALLATQRAFSRHDRVAHYREFIVELVSAGTPSSATHRNAEGASVLSLLLHTAGEADTYAHEAEECAVAALAAADDVVARHKMARPTAGAVVAAAVYDVDVVDGAGVTLLGLAVKAGSMRLCSELLRRGAKADFVTAKGAPMSPLLWAASMGKADMTAALLRQLKELGGALVDGGYPLLEAAIAGGHDAAAAATLAALPDARGMLQQHVGDVDADPLLVRVLGARLPHTARAIIAACPEFCSRREQRCPSRTPLMLAAAPAGDGLTRHRMAMRRVQRRCSVCHIARGKYMYVTRADRDFAACEPCYQWGVSTDIASELLSRDADVDARDAFELTPLHHAASAGRDDVATILLAAGATASALDGAARSPLHLAVAAQRPPAVVQLLLAAAGGAAMVNQADGLGRTPFAIALEHVAVGGEQAELSAYHVLLILQCGALTEASTPPPRHPAPGSFVLWEWMTMARKGSRVWLNGMAEVEGFEESNQVLRLKMVGPGTIVRVRTMDLQLEYAPSAPLRKSAAASFHVGDCVTTASFASQQAVPVEGVVCKVALHSQQVEVEVAGSSPATFSVNQTASKALVHAPTTVAHLLCRTALRSKRTLGPMLLDCVRSVLSTPSLRSFGAAKGLVVAALEAGEVELVRAMLAAGLGVGKLDFAAPQLSHVTREATSAILFRGENAEVPADGVSVAGLAALVPPHRGGVLDVVLRYLEASPPAVSRGLFAAEPDALPTAVKVNPAVVERLLRLGADPNAGRICPLVVALTACRPSARRQVLRQLLAAPGIDLAAGGVNPPPLAIAVGDSVAFEMLAAKLPPDSPQFAAALTAAAAQCDAKRAVLLAKRCAATPAAVTAAISAAAAAGHAEVCISLAKQFGGDLAPAATAALAARHFTTLRALLPSVPPQVLCSLRSADGAPIAVAAAEAGRPDVVAELLTLAPAAVLAPLAAPAKSASARVAAAGAEGGEVVLLQPAGRIVAGPTRGGHVRSDKKLPHLPPEGIRIGVVGSDGKSVAFVAEDGAVVVVDANGLVQRRLDPTAEPVAALARGVRTVMVAVGKEVKAIGVDSGFVVRQFSIPDGTIVGMCVDREGTAVVLLANDGAVYHYGLASLTTELWFKLDAPPVDVACTGTRGVFVVAADGVVTIKDGDGATERRFETGHPACALAVSANKSFVAVAAPDCVVRIYRYTVAESGTPLQLVREVMGYDGLLLFLPDPDSTLVVGGADLVWCRSHKLAVSGKRKEQSPLATIAQSSGVGVARLFSALLLSPDSSIAATRGARSAAASLTWQMVETGCPVSHLALSTTSAAELIELLREGAASAGSEVSEATLLPYVRRGDFASLSSLLAAGVPVVAANDPTTSSLLCAAGVAGSLEAILRISAAVGPNLPRLRAPIDPDDRRQLSISKGLPTRVIVRVAELSGVKGNEKVFVAVTAGSADVRGEAYRVEGDAVICGANAPAIVVDTALPDGGLITLSIKKADGAEVVASQGIPATTAAEAWLTIGSGGVRALVSVVVEPLAGDPIAVAAAKSWHPLVYRSFLRECASAPLVNATCHDGTTALFWAKDCATIDALCAAGANPSARDIGGNTAFGRLLLRGVACGIVPPVLATSEALSSPCVLAEGFRTDRTFVKGDAVVVDPAVAKPKYGWGSVTHKDVGVVAEVQGDSLLINFDKYKGWRGAVAETRHANAGPSRPELPVVYCAKQRRLADVAYILARGCSGRDEATAAELFGLAVELRSVALTKLLLHHPRFPPSVLIRFIPPDSAGNPSDPAAEPQMWPLLLHALAHGAPAVARVLIAEAPRATIADAVNAASPGGERALMHADSGAAARELLRLGADPMAEDAKGRGALYHLVARGVPVRDIPAELRQGSSVTQLYVCNVPGGDSSSTSPVVVGSLVRVKSGVKPLYGWGAVKPTSVGVVTVVSPQQCTIDFPEQEGWTGALEQMEVVQDSMTLLHIAASRDDAASCDELIRLGVSPNAVASTSGNTPLLVAVKAGAAAAVERLVAAGATLTRKELAAAATLKSVPTLRALGAHIKDSGQVPVHCMRLEGEVGGVLLGAHGILELPKGETVRSGRWYYEVEMEVACSVHQVGWTVPASFEPQRSTGVGDLPNSWGANLEEHRLYPARPDKTHEYGKEAAKVVAGTVLGVGLNADDGEVWFSVNGVHLGTAYSGIKPADGLVPAVSRFRQGEGVVLLHWSQHKHRPPSYLPIGAFAPGALCNHPAPAKGEIAVTTPHVVMDVPPITAGRVQFEVVVKRAVPGDTIRIGFCDPATFDASSTAGVGDDTTSWAVDVLARERVHSRLRQPCGKQAAEDGGIVTVALDVAASTLQVWLNGDEFTTVRDVTAEAGGLVPCVSIFGSLSQAALVCDELRHPREGFDSLLRHCARRPLSARRPGGRSSGCSGQQRVGGWWTLDDKDASCWHRANGDTFRGTIGVGGRSGTGSLHTTVGVQYDGGWVSDRMHGAGTLRYRGGVYVGSFDSGVRCGTGTETISLPSVAAGGEMWAATVTVTQTTEHDDFVPLADTSCAIPPEGIARYAVDFFWSDQGWGQQRGHLRLALVRSGCLVAYAPLGGGPAPHTRARWSAVLDARVCAPLALARVGDELVVQAQAGGSGCSLTAALNLKAFAGGPAVPVSYAGAWADDVREGRGRLAQPGAATADVAFARGVLACTFVAAKTLAATHLLAPCVIVDVPLDSSLQKGAYFEIKVERAGQLEVGFALHSTAQAVGSQLATHPCAVSVSLPSGARWLGGTAQPPTSALAAALPAIKAGDVVGVGLSAARSAWVSVNGGAQMEFASPVSCPEVLESGAVAAFVSRAAAGVSAEAVWDPQQHKHRSAGYAAITSDTFLPVTLAAATATPAPAAAAK